MPSCRWAPPVFAPWPIGCVELGIAHGDVDHRGEFGLAIDVADPDGLVLRFVAGPHTRTTGTFAGLEFELGSRPTMTDHDSTSRPYRGFPDACRPQSEDPHNAVTRRNVSGARSSMKLQASSAARFVLDTTSAENGQSR